VPRGPRATAHKSFCPSITRYPPQKVSIRPPAQPHHTQRSPQVHLPIRIHHQVLKALKLAERGIPKTRPLDPGELNPTLNDGGFLSAVERHLKGDAARRKKVGILGAGPLFPHFFHSEGLYCCTKGGNGVSCKAV
jgi:hypothetical protein